MIPDGYSRRAVLAVGTEQLRVVYRPLASSMRWIRQQWVFAVKHLRNSEAKEVAFDRWVLGQIVAWDWALDIGAIADLRRANAKAYNHLIRLLYGMEVDASGERWRDVEPIWAANLREGVILELTNPRLARRDCGMCQKYWYLDTGNILRRSSTGENELRPEWALPECKTEDGCAKGTPENQKSLNRANKWAYRHWQSCEAVKQFPDDEIVRSNAEIIRKAIADAERIKAKT